MSRIRSVHPGVYTDEAWASVSLSARWMAVGLMTQSDDNGVFEWKPLQLKMRLFPADSISIPELLAELHEAEIVFQFEHGGKQYGAIRNFCKYQRPRKPKQVHPLPDRIKEFVGFGSSSGGNEDGGVPKKSELDRVKEASVPQKSEKSSQMEDGGGSTVAIATDAEASPANPKERLWVEGKPMLVALGVPPKQSGSIIGRWLRDARDDAGKVLDAISRARDQCPHDPIPWITATLKQDAGNGKSDISTQFRNAFSHIDERIDALG